MRNMTMTSIFHFKKRCENEFVFLYYYNDINMIKILEGLLRPHDERKIWMKYVGCTKFVWSFKFII